MLFFTFRSTVVFVATVSAGTLFGAWQSVAAQGATPSPSPTASTMPPSPAPNATLPPATGEATPKPQALRELLLEGAYTVGKVYNDYAAGLTGTGSSYVASGAYRFGGYALKLDQRVDYFKTIKNQPGGTGFSTPDGGYEVVPPFLGKITSTDFRVEHSVFTKALYVGLSYVDTQTSYGYPDLQGVGAGIEKYSTFVPFDLYGYVFYYPRVAGTFLQTDPKSPNFGKSFDVSFSELKYSFEGSLPLSHDFYAYFGYGGYRMLKNTTSTVQNVEGPFLGFGTRLFRGGSALEEPEVTRIQQTVPTWSGYLELAARFGGENTLNAVPSAPDRAGSRQFGAAYRYGAFAVTADVHTDRFPSFVDPFHPVTPTIQSDTMTELRALYSVTPHDGYIGLGVLNKSNTNGYGSQTGPGIGLVKMPNLSGQFGYRLSIFYYGTNATINTPTVQKSENRRYLVYDYGVTYRPPSSALYGYLGYWGYHGNPGNQPIDETHSGPYLGVGVRFK
ncbi:MAG: hypothetical protein JO060_12050 [Candidatus Eremiobacteraeota bacterium]|nr:hypothetical protein [Candidatus Eremiobacteraeota bacterium]MBV9646033.1 hypothetical protein [Candidatus Eremiobacteraeota bacterium]